MSKEELNFKKMCDERYRVYRLLQSPTSVIQLYRETIKEIGKYRGAVIFPEQFISLYGQQLVRVSLNFGFQSFSVSVAIMRDFEIIGVEKDRLDTFDEVLANELLDSPNYELFSIRTRSTGWDSEPMTKSTVFYFSNKNDALSYMRKKAVL